MGIDPITELSDLDILRQIRDANPTSQLPSLWSEDKDPYTQWEGVTWNDSRVIALSMYSKGITTLPNVNKLTNLQYLDCGSSQLTSLDVTGLTNLQYLDCNSNQLTSLDVTGLTSLQALGCYSNQLTSLDVTGLSNLHYLYCSYNQLTSLDVTGLTALKYLDCNYNQLTSLDVTVLTALQELYCISNQLTNIPTLTSKGSITYYDFRYNNMQILETDRLIALGFNSNYVLPQNP